MENRQTGIIATIVATLLCGCPGLFMLCFGSIFAFVSRVPDTQYSGGMTPQSALGIGIGGLCLGIIFIIIPIVVGFMLLRKKPAAIEVANPDEPIPPAI
jgi:uncharacterized membrane protein